MLKILKIVLVVISIIGMTLLYNSCSERSLPPELTVGNGYDYTSSYDDTASFWFNFMGNNTFRELSVYTPPEYDPADTTTLYPVLYLLHGYGGDHDYFTHRYGLNEIADELIATGEIEPMIIATIDASSILGGGWYTNTEAFDTVQVIDTLYWTYTDWDEDTGNPIESTAVEGTFVVDRTFAGLYEDLVVQELKRQIENSYNVYSDRQYVGIGGHSMGGYGAMKLAMKHPDVYGSVSSMSGPLSFQLLIGWIDSVLAENGIVAGNENNETLFHNMTPTHTKPLTSMMLSMASVFSPYPIDDTTYTDSSYYVNLPIYDTLKTVFQLQVELPFNWTYLETETLDDDIWNKWLAEDCLSMLDSTYSSSLTNTAVYMDCGDNDELGIKAHNDAFDQQLTAEGITHEYIVYSGYVGNDANHADFISQRLREILKFHSENFQ
ncbi:MAG: hypothetical protein GF315_13635 [candidate division Zixibacteria bacterium]|nr:hypothetical protein [candidate division Zixibacteria bacterium]